MQVYTLLQELNRLTGDEKYRKRFETIFHQSHQSNAKMRQIDEEVEEKSHRIKSKSFICITMHISDL